MKTINSLIKNCLRKFSVIKFAVKTIWKIDRPYLFLLFISMFVFIIEPFLDLYMLRNVLNFLYDKNDVSGALYCVVYFSFLIIIMHIIKSYVMWYRSNHYTSFTHYFDILHAKKGMAILYENLEQSQTRDLLMRAAKGCSAVAKVGEFITELCSSLFQIIVTIAIIIRFCNYFVIVMILLAFICYIADRFVNNISYKNERKSYPIERKSEYFFNKMINPISEKEIRLYKAERFFEKKYTFHQKKLLELKNKTNIASFWNEGLKVFVVAFELFFAYIIASKKYIVGNICIGDITLYINSMTVFANAFFKMFRSISSIGLMENRIDDFNSLLDFEEKKLEEYLSITDSEDFVIEFKNVSYSYPNSDKKILDNLNFKLKKGDKIAIIGENGAGKSTFVKLLLRLYEPTEGEILLNGISYKNYSINDYYKLFSTVFQDFTIFAFSILDNILLYDSLTEETKKIVEDIIRKCELNNKIDTLPDGLDSYYTQEYVSSGISLSGGECQKIAIARAWYRNSNCIILDEPTSAIDPISEEKLFNSISSLFEGKTAVLISHRLSSVRLCDKILYFENGKIIEEGSHKELLNQKGRYYELYSIQSKWYK